MFSVCRQEEVSAQWCQLQQQQQQQKQKLECGKQMISKTQERNQQKSAQKSMKWVTETIKETNRIKG